MVYFFLFIFFSQLELSCNHPRNMATESSNQQPSLVAGQEPAKVKIRGTTVESTRYVLLRAPQCEATLKRIHAGDMTLTGSKQLTPAGLDDAIRIGERLPAFAERPNVHGPYNTSRLKGEQLHRSYDIMYHSDEADRCKRAADTIGAVLREKGRAAYVHGIGPRAQQEAQSNDFSPFRYHIPSHVVVYVLGTEAYLRYHQMLGISKDVVECFTPVMGAATLFEHPDRIGYNVNNPENAKLIKDTRTVCIHELMSTFCVGEGKLLWNNMP
jgi:hypothetical protein